MNQSQCHGPYRPDFAVQDFSAMRSPYSSSPQFSSSRNSYLPRGVGSSHQGVVTNLEQQDPNQLSPISPDQQQASQPLQPQPTTSRDTGSSRLKRRASQGSLLSKPSPVSRFLSKSNASLHLSSFEQLGLSAKSAGRIESRTQSAERPRFSSPSTASSSLAARASQSSPAVWDVPNQSDYPATLPPTPPEEDEHVAWNPKSSMLLFEPHISQQPGPMPMDEGPNMDNTPTGASSDTLGSPSDQMSNISPSSSGGSPGSSGEMDCDHSTWLENGIDAAGKFLCCTVDWSRFG